MAEIKLKIRDVSKPRLVAALLAELDAAWATISAENVENGALFQNTLQCVFKIPFEETEVLFDIGSDEANTLNCVCCYGGQRISFELNKTGTSQWKLPTKVSIIDLRSDKRMSFANKMYSAEIIGSRGASYGFAVDINRDYLAIDIDSANLLKEAEHVKVIIRLVNTSFDIFYNRCSVVQIKQLNKHSNRIILRFDRSILGNPDQRRHERRLIDSVSILFKGNPFADGCDEMRLIVQNLSNGGMTVALRKELDSSRMMPGLILKSEDPDLSFLIVWTQGESLGIRPLLVDPQQLAKWYKYVDRTAPPDNRMTSITRKELSDLLTHSGLLKGDRRTHLGREVQAHIIASAAGESPLLIQRCILPDESGAAGLHVSSKRITEMAWFFGEGAALIEQFGNYNAMLNACTNRMVWMSQHSNLFCRYLTGIWHYTVKSTASWGENIAKDPNSMLLDAVQISISSLLLRSEKNIIPCNIMFLHEISANERRTISLQFSAALYETFVGMDGTHPILNAELGRLGPYHRAITKSIQVSKEQSIIAHRVLTHNVWSSTGVTNSVFVIVPRNLKPAELMICLVSLASDEIAQGTDDILLIFDGPLGFSDEYKTKFHTYKQFSFLVHDLSLNKTLAFHDSDGIDRRNEIKRSKS